MWKFINWILFRKRKKIFWRGYWRLCSVYRLSVEYYSVRMPVGSEIVKEKRPKRIYFVNRKKSEFLSREFFSGWIFVDKKPFKSDVERVKKFEWKKEFRNKHTSPLHSTNISQANYCGLSSIYTNLLYLGLYWISSSYLGNTKHDNNNKNNSKIIISGNEPNIFSLV